MDSRGYHPESPKQEKDEDRDVNEAPRSSLLRRSSHFGYEGRKLRGIRRRRMKCERLNERRHEIRRAKEPVRQ
jgi:hypothetical protein